MADFYFGTTSEDDLYHWKYKSKRRGKDGKWIYNYGNNVSLLEAMDDSDAADDDDRYRHKQKESLKNKKYGDYAKATVARGLNRLGNGRVDDNIKKLSEKGKNRLNKLLDSAKPKTTSKGRNDRTNKGPIKSTLYINKKEAKKKKKSSEKVWWGFD